VLTRVLAPVNRPELEDPQAAVAAAAAAAANAGTTAGGGGGGGRLDGLGSRIGSRGLGRK